MSNARTVLVTGGARGIGRGIAQSFLEAGHAVMIADLGLTPDGDSDWTYELASRSEMARTVEELAPLGEIRSTPLDVTDAASCDAAVAATLEAFGRLDVLVNNAGVVDSGYARDVLGRALGQDLRRQREGRVPHDAGRVGKPARL